MEGHSGGLCLYWHEEVSFRLESFSNHHIVGTVENKGDFQWDFCGFYGWPRIQDKNRSWSLMCQITNNRRNPLLIGGEFNEILNMNEKTGGANTRSKSMENFGKTVADTGLNYLGLIGDYFT